MAKKPKEHVVPRDLEDLTLSCEQHLKELASLFQQWESSRYQLPFAHQICIKLRILAITTKFNQAMLPSLCKEWGTDDTVIFGVEDFPVNALFKGQVSLAKVFSELGCRIVSPFADSFDVTLGNLVLSICDQLGGAHEDWELSARFDRVRHSPSFTSNISIACRLVLRLGKKLESHINNYGDCGRLMSDFMIRECEKVLDADEENLECRFKLASAVCRYSGVREAEKYYRDILKEKPNNTLAIARVALSLIDKGSGDKAKELLLNDRKWEYYSLPIDHHNLALAYLRCGLEEEALGCLLGLLSIIQTLPIQPSPISLVHELAVLSKGIEEARPRFGNLIDLVRFEEPPGEQQQSAAPNRA